MRKFWIALLMMIPWLALAQPQPTTIIGPVYTITGNKYTGSFTVQAQAKTNVGYAVTGAPVQTVYVVNGDIQNFQLVPNDSSTPNLSSYFVQFANGDKWICIVPTSATPVPFTQACSPNAVPPNTATPFSISQVIPSSTNGQIVQTINGIAQWGNVSGSMFGNQTANTIFAGPASGSAATPSFRALVIADLCGGSGASSSTFLRGDCTWTAPTAQVAVPLNRIPVGTGTGITSSGNFTFNGNATNDLLTLAGSINVSNASTQGYSLFGPVPTSGFVNTVTVNQFVSTDAQTSPTTVVGVMREYNITANQGSNRQGAMSVQFKTLPTSTGNVESVSGAGTVGFISFLQPQGTGVIALGTAVGASVQSQTGAGSQGSMNAFGAQPPSIGSGVSWDTFSAFRAFGSQSTSVAGTIAGPRIAFREDPIVATVTKTVTGTAGQNTITVSPDNSGIVIGQRVSITGIRSSAAVTNISGTTITLSQNNLDTVSGAAAFINDACAGLGAVTLGMCLNDGARVGPSIVTTSVVPAQLYATQELTTSTSSAAGEFVTEINSNSGTTGQSPGLIGQFNTASGSTGPVEAVTNTGSTGILGFIFPQGTGIIARATAVGAGFQENAAGASVGDGTAFGAYGIPQAPGNILHTFSAFRAFGSGVTAFGGTLLGPAIAFRQDPFFAAASQPATASSGSNQLTLSATTGVVIGQRIQVAGVLPDTTVVSIVGNVVTMSQNSIDVVNGTARFYADACSSLTGYWGMCLNDALALQAVNVSGLTVTGGSQATFQTSLANSTTSIRAVPSGTSTNTSIGAFNSNDPTGNNTGRFSMSVNGSIAQLFVAYTGTGTEPTVMKIGEASVVTPTFDHIEFDWNLVAKHTLTATMATLFSITDSALIGSDGLIKSVAGVLTHATAGTDYGCPTNGTSGQVLTSNAAGCFGTALTVSQVGTANTLVQTDASGNNNAANGIQTPNWIMSNISGSATNVLLQSRSANSQTVLRLYPTGTVQKTIVAVQNSSDTTLTNYGNFIMQINGGTASLQSATVGSGTPVTTQNFGESSGNSLTTINWQFNGLTAHTFTSSMATFASITDAAISVAGVAHFSSGGLLSSSAVNLASEVTGLLPGANGGTGVNNGASTFTMGGNVAFSGAFTFTGTLTGNTSVTFPTSGTLATTTTGVTCGQLPALTGDVNSSAGSCATTVVKVNGVSFGSGPSTNTIPVVTGVNTVTYEAVPNAALAFSSVTINTTGPLGGGGALSLGGSLTLTCTTCATAAGTLTSNAVVIGGGSKALSTIGADTTVTHALFATAGAPAFRAIANSDLPGSGSVTLNGQAVALGASGNVNNGASAHTIALNQGTGAALTGAAAGTANQRLKSGGAGVDPSWDDLRDVKIIPFAAAPAGTAGAGVSYASGQWTATARAGTNNIGAALQAIPSTGAALQWRMQLPLDWDTSVQPYIRLEYASGSNTSGTVIWTVSSACTKADGSVSDDPAFNAESAFASQTMAVANRAWSQTGLFTLVDSGHNCVPGGGIIIRAAVSGTAAAAINAYQAIVTIPTLPVVQAE